MAKRNLHYGCKTSWHLYAIVEGSGYDCLKLRTLPGGVIRGARLIAGLMVELLFAPEYVHPTKIPDLVRAATSGRVVLEYITGEQFWEVPNDKQKWQEELREKTVKSRETP